MSHTDDFNGSSVNHYTCSSLFITQEHGYSSVGQQQSYFVSVIATV